MTAKMDVVAAKRRLQVCGVPRRIADEVLHQWSAVADDPAALEKFAHKRLMGEEHYARGAWGPVIFDARGIPRASAIAFSSLKGTTLNFNSPSKTSPHKTWRQLRDDIFGPGPWVLPWNGAYKANLSSSQKKALKRQKLTARHMDGVIAQQQNLVQMLEDAASDANVAAEKAQREAADAAAASLRALGCRCTLIARGKPEDSRARLRYASVTAESLFLLLDELACVDGNVRAARRALIERLKDVEKDIEAATAALAV